MIEENVKVTAAAPSDILKLKFMQCTSGAVYGIKV